MSDLNYFIKTIEKFNKETNKRMKNFENRRYFSLPESFNEILINIRRNTKKISISKISSPLFKEMQTYFNLSNLINSLGKTFSVVGIFITLLILLLIGCSLMTFRYWKSNK